MKQCVFNSQDYESPDGMLTSVWGPNMWHVLHTISFNYPVNPTKEEKTRYMNFIKSLQYVLPCRYCRINVKKNLKILKFSIKDMKNRDSFSRFIYKLHNLVNKMLGKSIPITYCEVRERYEHFRSRCVTEKIPKCRNTQKKQSATKTKKTKKKKKTKEKGCVKPLYGVKSMSVINIVPRRKGAKTIKISPKCVLSKK